jgi:hypothetical protein
MPVVREVMERASSEIQAILNDPNYKGKDILWASMAADSMKKQGPGKAMLN